jgi:hypothetical protein
VVTRGGAVLTTERRSVCGATAGDNWVQSQLHARKTRATKQFFIFFLYCWCRFNVR